jgi:hypothetical protein
LALDLDLDGAFTKLARAACHIEALQRELPIALNKRRPYAIFVGEIDPDGWASVIMRSQPVLEMNLGAIIGDVLHNLRSALDYVVAALVDKSGGQVTKNHQFPICWDECYYRANVGSESEAIAGKNLGGVIYGLKEIWDAQPFHQHPNPRENPLYIVNHFSNADKHRIICRVVALPTSVSRTIPQTFTILEEVRFPEGRRLPNGDFEMGRIRIAPPFPTDPQPNIDITVAVFFATKAFGNEPNPKVVSAQILEKCCAHIAILLQRFSKL